MTSAGSINRHVFRAWFIGDITGESDPGASRHVIRVQSREMRLRYQTVFVSTARVEKMMLEKKERI